MQHLSSLGKSGEAPELATVSCEPCPLCQSSLPVFAVFAVYLLYELTSPCENSTAMPPVTKSQHPIFVKPCDVFGAFSVLNCFSTGLHARASRESERPRDLWTPLGFVASLLTHPLLNALIQPFVVLWSSHPPDSARVITRLFMGAPHRTHGRREVSVYIPVPSMTIKGFYVPRQARALRSAYRILSWSR